MASQRGGRREEEGASNPTRRRASGTKSRFRERSLSTSPSMLSEFSDAGSPLSAHRRPALSRSLTGKAASAPSMVPPTPPPQEASALWTPHHAGGSGVLPFDSPGGRLGDGADGSPGVENGDAAGTTSGSVDIDVNGDGDGGKGGFKRGFKRMLQGVPSPSHFRRSMSFHGSVSAISKTANRVATGAMTPIRRRRHRREGSRDSSEGGLVSAAGEKPSSSRTGRSCGSSTHRSSRSSDGGDGIAPPEDGRGSSTKVDPVLLPGAKKHKRGKTTGGAGGGREAHDAAGLSSSDQSGGRGSGKISSSSRSSREKGSSSRNREKRASGKSREKSSSSSRGKDRSSAGGGGRQDRHSASSSCSAIPVEAVAQRHGIGAVADARSSPPGGADGPLVEWSWGSPDAPQERGGVVGGARDTPAYQRQQSRKPERAEGANDGGGSATGATVKQEDVSNGRPPSHDGRKPRVKHPPSSERHVLAPPQPSHKPPTTPASRGGGAISPLFSFGSDSSPASPPEQPQPLRSHTDEAASGAGGAGAGGAAGGKGAATARPLLARGRSFFGTGSGGTTHMFASSPRGARAAARRARSLHNHGSASSVWASEFDATPKNEDSIAKSLLDSRVVKAGSAGGVTKNGSDGAGGGGGVSAVEVATVEAGAEAADGGTAMEEDADGAGVKSVAGVAGGGGGGGGGGVESSAPPRLLSASRRLGIERSSSSGSLVNGYRSPAPVSSYVPPAPTPPLLSGAGSSSRSWGVGGSAAGVIDAASSASSDVMNSSGDARTGSPGELWARSPSPASKGPDLAAPKKGATGVSVGGRGLAPNLALAIAGLRSVSPEDRGDSRAAAGGAAAGGKGDEGRAAFGRGSLRNSSSSSSSSGGGSINGFHGAGKRPAGSGHRDGRGSPDSVNSEVSGDSSNGRRARRTMTALELEKRRAALIAASMRTSAEPPPPPPRLLSKAKGEASGSGSGSGGAGEVARPTPKKLLVRSKTTVAETTNSSQISAGQASAFSANRLQGGGSFDEPPSVVTRLRPEPPERQPRRQQQQQGAPDQTAVAAAAAAAATTSVPKNEDRLLVKFPVSSSLSPSSISSSTPPVQQRPLAGGGAMVAAAAPSRIVAPGDERPPAVVAPSPASSSRSSPGRGAASGRNGRPGRPAWDSPSAGLPASRPGGSIRHTGAATAAAVAQGGDSPARSDGNGSTRSLVPGPRLIPVMRFGAEPPPATQAHGEEVAAEAELQKARVGGGADTSGGAATQKVDRVALGRGSVDDLPPAEMGALGVSLVCAMCGTAEKKPSLHGVGSRKESAAAAAASVRSGGSGRGEEGEAEAEVEVTRCSRCRKGCCAACYKFLPVHCRGSKIVVPVCRDCFRGVDFENRWHDHLLATSRDRARSLTPGDDRPGESPPEPTSPRADSARGSPTAGGRGRSPANSDSRCDDSGRAVSVGGAGSDRAGSSGPPRREQKHSSSLLRASARLFRRSMSSNALDPPPPPPPPPAPPAAEQERPPPASLELFKTVSMPMARRPNSLPGGGGGGGRAQNAKALQEAAKAAEASKALREASKTGGTGTATTASVASSSTMSWFGSSIGSALSSLGGSSGAGNNNNNGGAGNGLSPAFSPSGGEDRTPPSARLTPASPSSASSAFEREVETRAVGGAAPARTPWATAGSPITVELGVGVDEQQQRGKARVSPVLGRGSPALHSRLGRDPTECPCGAAALYREVMEADGKGMAVAMVAAGGEAVGAEAAAAELEAKARSAHKLLRAKAFAHLLTRAAKAAAYADLQVKAFRFLREQGAAAKAEEALLSLKSKAVSLSQKQSFLAAPAPAPTPALVPSVRGGGLPGPAAAKTTANGFAAAGAGAGRLPAAASPIRNPPAVVASKAKAVGAREGPAAGAAAVGGQQTSACIWGGGGGEASAAGLPSSVSFSPRVVDIPGAGANADSANAAAEPAPPPPPPKTQFSEASIHKAAVSSPPSSSAGTATTTAAASSTLSVTPASQHQQQRRRRPRPGDDCWVSEGGTAGAAVGIGESGTPSIEEQGGSERRRGAREADGQAASGTESSGRGGGHITDNLRRARDLTSRKASSDRQQRRRWSNDDDDMAFFSGEEEGGAAAAAAHGGGEDDVLPGDRPLNNLKSSSRDSLSGREEAAPSRRVSASSGSGSRMKSGARDSITTQDSSSSRRNSGSAGGSAGGGGGRRDSSSSRRDSSRDRSSSRRDNGRGRDRDRDRSASRSRGSGGRETSSRRGSESESGGSEWWSGWGADEREEKSAPAAERRPSQGQPQHLYSERQRLWEATAQALEQQKQRQHRQGGEGERDEEGRGHREIEADAAERERVQRPRRPSYKYTPLPDSMSVAAAAAVATAAAGPARRGSAFSALGAPPTTAAIAEVGGGAGSAAQGATRSSSFGDASVDEMIRLVQEREAFFENMISGPGIAATKFPRRGRPRDIVLTLVLPSQGGGGGGSASSGGSIGGVPSGGGGGDATGRPGFGWRGAGGPLARATSNMFEGGDTGGASRSSSFRSTQSLQLQHQPQPQQQQQQLQGPRSLQTVLELELVWNRQRGGKGSLRVGEVIDALAGKDSQVLRPVCEELRKRAASRGGPQGEGAGEEEDTFVSLRTSRRTLDLKFPTVPTRNRFMLAFKTLAWETAAAEATGGVSGRSTPAPKQH